MANKKATFVQQVHQANLKCQYLDGQYIKTVYRQLKNANTDHLDYAIKNMAFKSGMVSVETITPEEYKEATGESKA